MLTNVSVVGNQRIAYRRLAHRMAHATIQQNALSADQTGRPLISIAMLVGWVALVWGLLSESLLGDPDSYWHIAVGRWIVANGRIPTSDPFSHSVPGMDWTAHEWLSELVFFGVHQFGGWQAVQVLAALMFAGTVAYTLRFLLDRMQPLHAVLLSIVCLELMRTHLLARPHVLVWPLTALWVATLVEAGEKRVAPPWWLLAVLLLWTNLHASFTLALGFGGALAMDAVLQHETMSDRIAAARRWALFLLACSVCVLLNPRGYGAIVYTLEVMSMKETLSIVSEWRSADFHQFHMFLVWLLGVMALGFAGRLRLSPIRIVFVVGLTYLALKHRRYHALVGLVSPFLLAAPLGEAFRARVGVADPRAAGLDRAFARLAMRVRLPGLGLGVLVSSALIALMWATLPSRPNAAATPERALMALERSGVRGNVLNEYGLGGYLIYRNVPVFIDGRGDMYGDQFMEQMRDAYFLGKPLALEALLTKYRIAWTLLAPRTPAVELLNHLPGWTRLYGDSVAVVHVRTDLLPSAAPTPVTHP